MIEKTEDEIVAECLRVLKVHESTRHVTHVAIIPIGPSGTADNWHYGKINPRLDPDAAQTAHGLIMSVADRWALKG